MRLRLPKLYPISDVQLSGLSHADQVAAFCRGGATFIQLRDKASSPHEFYTQAKQALEVARCFDAKLLINDRVDIALAIGADGVHLGHDDMPAAAARGLLGAQAIIGFSTHSLSQAAEARNLPVDYLAIGPIFSTTTKEHPAAQVGLKGLEEVRSVIGQTPLVAIGGITLQNSAEVLAAGADSLAIISGLVSDGFQIEARTRQFVSQF